MGSYPSLFRTVFLLAAAWLCCQQVVAMTSNVHVPFGSKVSSLQPSGMVFYSAQSDNLMFDALQGDLVIQCQATVRAVSLRWRLSRNLFNTPILTGEGIAQPANRFEIRIPSSVLRPGFFELNVRLSSGGTEPDTDAKCVFGYRAAEMQTRAWRPADFTEFWARGKAELAKIPLDATVDGPLISMNNKAINDYNLQSASLPADYDPKGHKSEDIVAYKVSFATVGGLRIHAWLAKPKGKGPFPAMLVLPGAGFNSRPIPAEQARHGYLAMDIQIHGQEVDQEKYEHLPGYGENDPVFEPIDAYYYYKVYLSVLQAVNYLAARPDVDTKRIVAVGGSQGGRLSVVIAGLDSRIVAVVPAIPHAANQPYMRWASRSNAARSNGMQSDVIPPPDDSPQSRCLAYYDPLNFAPDITCPVYMNAGLIDRIAPPVGGYGVFQLIASKDKTFVPLTGLGHDWSAEFDRRAWRWLDERLAAKK